MLIGQLSFFFILLAILWKVNRLHPIENIACFMLVSGINLDVMGVASVNFKMISFLKTPDIFWFMVVNITLIVPLLNVIAMQFYFATSSILKKALVLLCATLIMLANDYLGQALGAYQFIGWRFSNSFVEAVCLLVAAIGVKHFTALLISKGEQST